MTGKNIPEKYVGDVFLLGVIAHSFAVIVWVFWSRYPAVMDFTEWLYQAFLIYKGWFVGDFIIREEFYLVAYPVPNSLSQIGMALLNFLGDPIFAGRTWLFLYLTVWALLFIFIFRNNRNVKFVLPVLFFSIVLGSSFWNGFINYQFSLLIFSTFLYITYITEKIENSNMIIVSMIICGYSVLIFFTHFTTFCIFLFYLLFWQMELFLNKKIIPTNHNEKKFFFWLLFWKKENLYQKKNYYLLFSILPCLLLSLWYLLNIVDQLPSNSSVLNSFQEYILYKVYTVMKLGPFHNFILPSGKSFLENWPTVYWFGFMMNLFFAVFISVSILYVIVRIYFIKEDKLNEFRFCSIVISFLFSMFLFLILPTEFVVVNLGERFFVIGLLLFLFLCVKEKCLPKIPIIAMGCLFLLLLPYYIVKLEKGTILRKCHNPYFLF